MYWVSRREPTPCMQVHTYAHALHVRWGEKWHCIWVELKLHWLKNKKMVFTFFSLSLNREAHLRAIHLSLSAVLITTLLARKDSGAAESFSEGHLWLTAPGRPPHPASIANEQTQGFSFRLIIVTMNEFQVLLDVVLSISSSHQPVNHLGPHKQPPICQHKHRCTLSNTHTNTDTPKCAQQAHTYTHMHAHQDRKSDELIKMWRLSGK